MLREEHRLKAFENRVLRRIFGTRRDEIIGGWRKLHDEKLHNLYSSASLIRIIKSKEDEMSRVCRTYGREEGFSGTTRRKELSKQTKI
jgi:hypothetical protein